MRVIVDTVIWSLALRRRAPMADHVVAEFRALVAGNRIQLVGPIRQEILSGIRELSQFERLSQILAAFPDLPIAEEDYVLAARYFNAVRAQGVQGSNTDFLICALASRYRMAIFTTDIDFQRYQAHLPIKLHRLP